MTRTLTTAAAAVALLASPAGAATGTPGPFAGVVRQGETRTHWFDNNPLDQPCPNPMTTYVVALHYTPTTDVLTLSVGSTTVTGSGGGASIGFVGNWCTAFDIRVGGASVANVAVYRVTVTQGTGTT